VICSGAIRVDCCTGRGELSVDSPSPIEGERVVVKVPIPSVGPGGYQLSIGRSVENLCRIACKCVEVCSVEEKAIRLDSGIRLRFSDRVKDVWIALPAHRNLIPRGG